MFYGEGAASASPQSSMRYDLVAHSVGGHGERITSHDEVRPALERALKAADQGVPAVVDAVTDPQVLSDLMKNLGGLHVM